MFVVVVGRTKIREMEVESKKTNCSGLLMHVKSNTKVVVASIACPCNDGLRCHQCRLLHLQCQTLQIKLHNVAFPETCPLPFFLLRETAGGRALGLSVLDG